MGTHIIDQYSLLHFAVGIIVYFWGIKFWVWFWIHLLFELIENTNIGIMFINKYITIWPGGKPHPDTFINSFGDQLFSGLGWLVAYFADKISKEKHLYY